MMKTIITLISLFAFVHTNGQKTITVKGSAKTDDGKALAQGSVSLYYIGLKDTLRTLTNDKGNYTFNNVKVQKVMISISHIGYKKFVDTYDFTNATDEVINNDVVMSTGDHMLETVTVESSKIAIKEDTVAYKIDSTMFRKNDNVEEVLKKLPGVEVDKDGKVTAQGKEVTKVKVNGKEFFGGDVKTATRQLDADMVDKIQIIDDYGDQSAFTGVKDGEPTKTMNIQLKKDKNKGIFGNATAGVGNEKRYITSLSLNRFNNAQQISFTGNINNTNASTFDFSRLPGGMGAIAGGMVRSFSGGAGGLGFGNNDGVGVTKTFGVNYRDDWSPKVSVNGSYSFSQKNTTVLNDLFQEYPNPKNADSTRFNKQTTNDYTVTDNHRFSFTVDYKIDSFNFIKFNPGITFRKLSDSYQANTNYFYEKPTTQTLSVGNNSDFNKSLTPNFTGSLLFNHRFHKKGRTLSLNFNAGKSYTDGNDDILNTTNFYAFGNYFAKDTLEQRVIQQNNNHNYGLSLSFNEQLSKKHGLEFNYAYNKRFIENDKQTFDMAVNPDTLIPAQTNIYNNIYTTNRFGVNFRTTLKKYNYTIGLAAQPAILESNSFSGSKISYKQNFINYFPTIRLVYNFSKSKSFNLSYNGNTNQPTYQQSQPVPDKSNIQNTIIGNPDLKPEFSNTFSMRFNNFNFISGNVFFSNVSATFVKDKIVNNVSRKDFGAQQTRYLNEDGYFNVNAFYTISKPIQNRKYVFNYGGAINYNNNISYLNFDKNIGRNWVLSQRFSLDYKIKKWLETSGGVVYSLNDVKNSLSIATNNNNIKGWNFTHSSRLFFKYDYILSYDVSKTLNDGYTTSVDANPLIINATLEKQIFKNKNGSFKLQAFDLLNENTNVSRNVSSTMITDTKTNRLQRYFMLSFVFRFNKFSGSSKSGPGMMPVMPGGPGGGRGEIRMMGGPGF
jgi:Outer membrane protein beta-barrel family